MATSTQEEGNQPTWPQLLGTNNWEARKVPSTHSSSNAATSSKPPTTTSTTTKSSFFHKVMLTNPAHYKVTCFFYATARVTLPEAFILHSLSRESWDRESNWIGYIAVTYDEIARASGLR